MRYQSILPFLLVLLWGSCVFASVSESEPNSTVRAVIDVTRVVDPLNKETRSIEVQDFEVDESTGEITDSTAASNLDTSLANPLPLADEIIGQLSGTRDYDWYVLEVADPPRQLVTPVYFGCNYKDGLYLEGFEAGDSSPDPKDVNWQVEYYYEDADANLTLQSSYVIYPAVCKQATSDTETKGPFRFQMNTSKPGKYYIRIWGRYLGLVTTTSKVTSSVNALGEPFTDAEGNATTGEITTTVLKDKIAAQTADYSIRVYTTRIEGELEPNDGAVEAYPLKGGATLTSQLSSMYDQDWFYFDTSALDNPITKLPLYFTCRGEDDSVYILSSYNKDGVVQTNYEIKGSQCSGANGGFTFTIDTPAESRYFVSVKSPTYSDANAFTQSDYSILAAPNTQSGTPGRTRKDGELEPNENPVDAFPLVANVGITGQLSKTADFDWYSIANDSNVNVSGVTQITFKCGEGSSGTSSFRITAHSPDQVIQNDYTIGSSACSQGAGFKFDMNTHDTATYYISIAAGDQTNSETLNQGDYVLTWSFVTANGGSGGGEDGTGISSGGVEPNSTVVSSTLGDDNRTHEVDITGKINDLANLDASLATRLPLTDAIVGQLSGTRDYDWYYVDVNTDSAKDRPITPVYFGCDFQDGIFQEGYDTGGVPEAKDVSWQVNYYYDDNPEDTKLPALQSSYVVVPNICKRGTSTTKGPFRFEMNTQVAGRYYVRIWGRFVGVLEKKLPDGTIQYIDQVVAQSADYNLQVYTTHADGELEPNDGRPEAYRLTAGKAVNSQLASMYDVDWFYFDTRTVDGVSRLPFTFTCPATLGNTSTYILSTYDVNGVLQSNYEVSGNQCNTSGGFTFAIDTPAANNYYVKVISPTYSENTAFTQVDYTLQANPNVQTGTPGKTRKDGELEPNENTVDAFPLPSKVGITGQLSSPTDLDWYSFDYVASSTTTGVTIVTFVCSTGVDGSVFLLSAFNSDSKLQNDYTVTSTQCNTTGGFKFSIATPTTGTYFVRVAAGGTSATTLNQNDYTLTWTPVTSSGTGGNTGGETGGASRQPGELEPNDTLVNAVPLTTDAPVTSQLSIIGDIDYFYVDNDVATNTLDSVPVYFKCNLSADSGKVFRISALNTSGVLQNNYLVGADMCAASSGFRFDLATPNSGRYYIGVAGPEEDQADNFSDADYTLSLYAQVAQSDLTSTTSVDGLLDSMSINNRTAANKDKFRISMKQCDGNGKRGTIELDAKRLNLPKLDKDLQVTVQIGSWLCKTRVESMTIDDSDSGRKYQFPEPQAPAPKTRQPKAYSTN